MKNAKKLQADFELRHGIVRGRLVLGLVPMYGHAVAESNLTQYQRDLMEALNIAIESIADHTPQTQHSQGLFKHEAVQHVISIVEEVNHED